MDDDTYRRQLRLDEVFYLFADTMCVFECHVFVHDDVYVDETVVARLACTEIMVFLYLTIQMKMFQQRL